MNRTNTILIAISLILLGLVTAGYSCWLYQRLALAEARGLHLSMHWFFYSLYKLAGKGPVCLVIGIIGLVIAGLGIRKSLMK